MFRNIAPKPTRGGVRRARELRGEMSLPEILLWRLLRARPFGLKFRKQHPSGKFTLDFYCSDARRVIEVDGAAHRAGDRPARDEARDAWFAAARLETMRIEAAAVLADPVAAAQVVIDRCRARLPLHHPAAPGGPPPRDELGEER